MANPFVPPGWRKKNESPPPPNSFQRELQAKMQERKNLGLSADLTPTESEDELASDDELMSDFNMTNKKGSKKTWQPPNMRKSPAMDRTSPSSNRSKSPYESNSRGRSPAEMIFGKKTPTNITDEEDDYDGPSDLMMTMKKPWNPKSFSKDKPSMTMPNPKSRKSKAMEALDEDEEDAREKTWAPPSFMKRGLEKENKPLRPKSPSVRGRVTPTSLLDSIDEDTRPTPSPRSRNQEKPKPQPRGRTSPKGKGRDYDEDEDELISLSARRESPLAGLFSKNRRDSDKNDGRKTPSDGRRTPLDGRKTPSDNRKTPVDGRKTPSMGRKTPDGGLFGRKTPPVDRKTPMDDRKSPLDNIRGNKDGKLGDKRKTPVDESSPAIQKKSMMDMFSANAAKPGKPKKKTSYLQDSDSEDEHGAPRRSPSPMMKGRRTPSEEVSFRPGLKNKDRRTPDHEDEIDGFRMGPSLRNKRGESPEIKGRSGSPNDRNRPWGDAMKPSLRNRHQDDDEDYIGQSAFRPTPSQRGHSSHEERGRSRTQKDERPERESSLCREVEKDPTMKKQQEATKQKKLAKAHTVKGRMLEDAIVSVENAQDKTMKFIDPDKSADEETKEEKNTTAPNTMRLPKHRPKPRYVKPVIQTTPGRPRSTDSFNSTTDIRDAVYQQWYKERMEKSKQAKKEEIKKQKELEEKKKKQEEDKFVEAKASYQAWVENKKDYDKNRYKKKHQEEDKKREEEQKKWEKQKEAEKTFEIWKENKEARIREQERKKKKVEERKRDDEYEKKRRQTKDSSRAFDKWKENKDDNIKKGRLNENKSKKQQEEEESKEKERQEREALESYEKWMSRKEKQQQREHNRRRRTSEDEFSETRPAWSPASRTIPVGR